MMDTDTMAFGDLDEVGARHFCLCDNLQLLFRPPTMATLDTGYDLHAVQRPTIFATLLRVPLESETVGEDIRRSPPDGHDATETEGILDYGNAARVVPLGRDDEAAPYQPGGHCPISAFRRDAA